MIPLILFFTKHHVWVEKNTQPIAATLFAQNEQRKAKWQHINKLEVIAIDCMCKLVGAINTKQRVTGEHFK